MLIYTRPPSWIFNFRLLTYFWLSSVHHQGYVVSREYGCSHWKFVSSLCIEPRIYCMLYVIHKMSLPGKPTIFLLSYVCSSLYSSHTQVKSVTFSINVWKGSLNHWPGYTGLYIYRAKNLILLDFVGQVERGTNPKVYNSMSYEYRIKRLGGEHNEICTSRSCSLIHWEQQ